MIKIQIPNLQKLINAMNAYPEITDKEFKNALYASMLAIEKKAKPMTPVVTGRLRASIGGGSFKGGEYADDYGIKVERRQAMIGSDVKYAAKVESRIPFLGTGLFQAQSLITRIWGTAVGNIFTQIFNKAK
jgi:hypothetical protein